MHRQCRFDIFYLPVVYLQRSDQLQFINSPAKLFSNNAIRMLMRYVTSKTTRYIVSRWNMSDHVIYRRMRSVRYFDNMIILS